MYLKAHKYIRTNINYKYYVPIGTKSIVYFMTAPKIRKFL